MFLPLLFLLFLVSVGALVPSWSDIESYLGKAATTDPGFLSIDSVLQPGTPAFSKERPILFRERHGWCPYSERVWLALEHLDVVYDTVRIDNTGGPRPRYFGGQTPQMRWPGSTRTQGESLDLVEEVDRRYASERTSLFRKTKDENASIRDMIAAFRGIFPQGARPSSRAAFLFQWNGDPLWRSTFEETLQKTDQLLKTLTLGDSGPFFGGSETMTAADVAWAPFLERYRYQLPCLHEGLDPYDPDVYPRLHRWYNAMDTRVPAYACRIKGDASSWRKVLTMAGFGNAGVPPDIVGNMQELAKKEVASAHEIVDTNLWQQYAATRPFLASSPRAQAALVLAKNRNAIVKDTMKRAGTLPSTEQDIDKALLAMADILLHESSDAKNVQGVGPLAVFLDDRMCVPRDMGAMSAACIKILANELGTA